MSRRGGGLYSNFVPLNDSENRPYRGAEIPPPTNLQGHQGNSNRNYGGVPPPANFHGSSSNYGSGVNKQGYSTINSISAGMPGNFQPEKEINVRKARTEDDYFNEADDEDYQIGGLILINLLIDTIELTKTKARYCIPYIFAIIQSFTD